MPGTTDDDEGIPLDWIIRERSNVQSLACELLGLIEGNKDSLSKDRGSGEIAALMIGVAFSLWRAIFLAPKRPTPDEDMIAKGATFLRTFLRDNTISYSDEKSRKEWSFGYYLNNVKFDRRKFQSG
jgi:hypothetical protein